MDLKEIIENVDEEDRLFQLAEECNELSQAVFKLYRYKKGTNKPKGTLTSVYNNLMEEIADVSLCLDVVVNSRPTTKALVKAKKEYKLKRWIDRIHGDYKW